MAVRPRLYVGQKGKRNQANPFGAVEEASSSDSEEEEDEATTQAKECAVLQIQAAWRGKSGRSAAREQKAIDERRRTLTENLPPPQLFEGRERVLEVKTDEGLLSLPPHSRLLG